MSRYLRLRWRHPRIGDVSRPIRRKFSTSAQVEHVSVPCASSGSITVSLHNVFKHPTSVPLLVYIPPLSMPPQEALASLPSCFAPYPTAIINYRWPDSDHDIQDPCASAPSSGDTIQEQDKADIRSTDVSPTPLHWPTSLHDALFGYEWITRNLSAPARTRRDIYVVGSYLGAGIATSLSLTESHTHQPFAVRGFAAYNGIYNWTTFLPDHPLNRVPEDADPLIAAAHLSIDDPDDEDHSHTFRYLRQCIPSLFKCPSNLFDPFASPCLFFHTSGMLVPPDFTHSALEMPSSLARAIEELSTSSTASPAPSNDASIQGDPLSSPLVLTAPRKAHLVFPPRQSSLKIPEALFLHDSAPSRSFPPAARRRRGQAKGSRRRAVGEPNSFAAQARDLAALMRRSVNMVELKERMRWDEDFGDWDHEAERRVRVEDAGWKAEGEGRDWDWGVTAGEMLSEWLEERMGR